MSNTSTHSSTRRLTEGGICIALALVLSYLKIPIGLSFGGFGGSITLVMVPLILFAVRYGALWGILAGVAFGTLKYFFAEGFAVSWVSIIFDYSVAYGAVGLAGLFRVKDNDYSKLPLAAFVGCLGRFVIHFISGVTVYAQYMPEEFMGMTMTSPVFYSVLYNGTYMLPNTILAIVICALLMNPQRSCRAQSKKIIWQRDSAAFVPCAAQGYDNKGGVSLFEKEIPLPYTLPEEIFIASEQLEEVRCLPIALPCARRSRVSIAIRFGLLLSSAAALLILFWCSLII